MTDETRAALVEELAESMWNAEGSASAIAGPKPWQSMTPSDIAYDMMDTYRLEAENVLPIIDRLLAERDIDAMLNAVHPDAAVYVNPYAGDMFGAQITWPCDEGAEWHRCLGLLRPTRAAAIADACRKAREGRDDE